MLQYLGLIYQFYFYNINKFPATNLNKGLCILPLKAPGIHQCFYTAYFRRQWLGMRVFQEVTLRLLILGTSLVQKWAADLWH